MPETREPREQLILRMGTFIHETLQKILQARYEKLGYLYLPETEVTIGEHVHGHCDALVIGSDGFVECQEYKTCSQSVFDGLSAPGQRHERQLQIYLEGLRSPTGRFLYISRNDCRMKEYPIRKGGDVHKEIMGLIDIVDTALANKVAPKPRPEWAVTAHCTAVCKFRHLCPAAKSKRVESI